MKTNGSELARAQAGYRALAAHLTEEHGVGVLDQPIGPRTALMALHARLHDARDGGRLHLDEAWHRQMHD